MKVLVLVALALVACKKEGPSSVMITAQAPPVGQITTAVSEHRATETLTLQGTDLAIVRDHGERRRSEVLEVSATAATKLRVTYEARTERETKDGQARDLESPLAGKTYVVWRDGEDVRALGGDGGEVSDDEAALLADDHLDLGRPAQMEALITGRTWKRGEAVHFTAAELQQLDHEQGTTAGGSQTTAATVTLTSLGGGIATFTTSTQYETDNASVTMSAAVNGTIKLEVAHARPVQIDINVNGRGLVLTGGAAGAAIQITNRGTQRYTYQSR